jgi:hypothetical protein
VKTLQKNSLAQAIATMMLNVRMKQNALVQDILLRMVRRNMELVS